MLRCDWKKTLAKADIRRYLRKFNFKETLVEVRLTYTITGLWIISMLLVCAVIVIPSIFISMRYKEYFFDKNISLIDGHQQELIGVLAGQAVKKILLEYESYAKFISTFASLEEIVMRGDDGLVRPDPMFYDIPQSEANLSDPSGTTLIKKSIFFSSYYPLSKAGFDLIHQQAVFDHLYPLLDVGIFNALFVGYPTDLLFNNYPGAILDEAFFDPTIREWYYKAQNAHGLPIITEPYIDFFTKNWVITVSQELSNENGTFAVVGGDLLLKEMDFNFLDVNFMQEGFFIYLTNTGLMINTIGELSVLNNGSPLTFFDIGISQEMWKNIQDENITSKYIFEYALPTGKKYWVAREIGKSPLYAGENFYILACFPQEYHLMLIFQFFSYQSEKVLFVCFISGLILTGWIGFVHFFYVKKLEKTVFELKNIIQKKIHLLFFDKDTQLQGIAISEKNSTESVNFGKYSLLSRMDDEIRPFPSHLNTYIYDSWEKNIYSSANPIFSPSSNSSNQITELESSKKQPNKFKALIAAIEDYEKNIPELAFY